MAQIQIAYEYYDAPDDTELLERMNDHAIEHIAGRMSQQIVQGELFYHEDDDEYNGWFEIIYIS